MSELTVEKLKAIESAAIFESGTTEIEHPWNANEKLKVKWVAKRGDGFHDWAIYHSFHDNLTLIGDHLVASNARIASNGQKLYDTKKVQELVPCDRDALALYRR